MHAEDTDSLTAPVVRAPGARERLRARVRAVGWHLGISLLIFAGLMYLIVFDWYPGVYFHYDGGWRGTIIVVCVDLVLGPTLTGIVYDLRKPWAKTRFDLIVIGALQAVALAWGIHAVESQRPVAAVLFDGAFRPLTAELLRAQDMPIERLRAMDANRPPLLYASVPTDPEGIARMVERLREEGLAAPLQVDLLEPVAEHGPALAAASRIVSRLAEARAPFRAERDDFLAAHGLAPADVFLVPFYGRYGQIVFVVGRDGRLLGALEQAFVGIL